MSLLGVSLLGVVEAHDSSGPVPIRGAKQQALLALLALSVPRAVSEGRLLDELWGDQQPAKPANALQAQVSQLRRLLGRDIIVRDPAGYALVVEPEAVDALRLERLVRQGREAAADGHQREATTLYVEAISLSRGPPFGDVLDHPFVREATSRLEQLRQSAHEGHIEAELSLGRHADVIEALGDLIKAYPLSERFHAQLITALYRGARQIEALRAYQHVRDLLADELGLEPGPELQALERAVLSHDPALQAPVPLAAAVHLAPLPTPLTSLVGRDADLIALEEEIHHARLVTLVGPGGVGKTRLVLEAAHRLARSTEVWFVELAPITDPAAVPEAVAAALGALDQASPDNVGAGRPALQRAIDRIGHRDVIAILDNCEHVAEAVSCWAKAMLASCTGLTVVATSREPLGLDCEWQHPVGPLDDRDAAHLFTERALAVQPLFGSDGQTDELVGLCRRLDGLPLAIELAAARAKTLPLQEIAARLDDRFRLLRTSRRGVATRHQGLGAAIDWSYDMLFEDERRAFCQLAVFPGGATVDAARQICGDDALDVISRLVDKSLLVADTSGPESRFRMLESLRAYGLQRLADCGELDAALTQHLNWCTALAEEAEPHVRRGDQLPWLERLDVEHDNLRAALAHAATADPDGGVRLIGVLILPWWFRGRRQEARHWAETCLAAANGRSNVDMAKALAWCGLLADSAGWTEQPNAIEQELDLAERRQRRAIALSLQADDEHTTAYCRSLLGGTLARRAVAGVAVDQAELTDLVASAASVFERDGDHFGAGLVRAIEAIAALGGRDLDCATTAIDAAAAHGGHSGDRFTRSRAEWIKGTLDDLAGDVEGAYRRIERSLRLLDELGMGQAVTAQAGLLISLAERAGHPELALQWRTFVDGRGGGVARFDSTVMASTRNGEGMAARESGDLRRALTAHLEALACYHESGVAGGTAFTESCLGFLAAEMGETAAAIAHHAAALAAATASGEPPSLALALEGTAAGFTDDDADRAAVLLGAADGLWRDSAPHRPATHGHDITAITERARTALGEAEFSAAFARGRVLSLAEVLTVAESARRAG